jgi:hypothetical protein
MWKNDGKYFVYVREFIVRIYDDDTLPDFIKMRLSMILALDRKFSNGGYKPTQLDLFINHAGKEFEEIGWQIDDEYFTLVLKTEELASLQGEPLNKESSVYEC